ncbi:Rpn family recombination-promoting nuclease/putative transposase [Methylocaldum gracile subsp. desertum]|uniref:Rpn family recombination-promoting nuclease/putative transposase n=1 Tax=Methylocaldum sp. GT1BW TaxID=3438964 RepID=UPI003DA127DF
MAQPLTDPHDRFFRETFSRRDVAEGFLRNYLPTAVADRINGRVSPSLRTASWKKPCVIIFPTCCTAPAIAIGKSRFICW